MKSASSHALALVVLTASTPAFASASAAVPPAPAENPSEGQTARVRAGALVGVGFPRPLSVEALVAVGSVVALGAEYGVLPATTVDGVRTDLWSLSGDARFFPFRGPFFVGLRAGHMHVGAGTTITVAPYGSASEELSLDTWFVNPRVGLLWTSREGLALAVEAGLELPIGSSISSTLPLSLVPAAQHTVDTLGNSVIPTVDLLRIGVLF